MKWWTVLRKLTFVKTVLTYAHYKIGPMIILVMSFFPNNVSMQAQVNDIEFKSNYLQIEIFNDLLTQNNDTFILVQLYIC